MSKNVTITKEMILASAFDIVREKGLEGISNRELAKKLNCSIRPIYYQFQNVEELYNELYVEIEKYFYKFLMDNMNDDMPKYKQVGINYIKFAKEEKEFFKILFMSEVDLGLNDFIAKDMEDFKELSKLIKISTNLNDEDIESFHMKMWIFSHGLATLVASSTINISDKQLKQLLSLEFQALMLLKENPNNKWVLKNGVEK
jgi:AcrR family transcriptional regulator